uniref:Uncharacterized protein n=1 Tax=Opuntia streptacantha TaxID=393608 RepID=A0A7C9ATT2_OPUST
MLAQQNHALLHAQIQICIVRMPCRWGHWDGRCNNSVLRLQSTGEVGFVRPYTQRLLMAYYAIKPSSSPSKMLLCLTKKLALRCFLNELDLSQGNSFELMASGS